MQKRKSGILKKRFSHYICFNLIDLVGHQKLIKNGGPNKWYQQVIKIEALGVQGILFLLTKKKERKKGCWQYWCFYVFFVWQKGGSKTHVLGGFRGAELRFWMPCTILRGTLYWQILARLYILLFDNA